MKNLRSSALLLLLLCFAHSWGQDQQETSLITYLNQVEEQFDVRFSYDPEWIEGVGIKLPGESDALDQLDEVLNYLNASTPLQFARLNDRYITISPNRTGASGHCGQLLDGETGLPLVGANLLIGDGRSGTTTDQAGRFYVPNSLLSQDITASYIGYEPMAISVAELGSNCPVFFLQPLASSLGEVVVRSFLVRGINRTSDGATNLNTRNFGLLPGQVENDVLQLTQALPGVESVDETISTINIRGGTSDENLITWEGIRVYQNGHFFGLITALNPSITQSVSVYKNGTPSRYGEGVSGVMDIRTDNLVAQELKAGASVNLINGGGFVSAPISSNTSIQLAGRYSNNDIWQTPVYDTFAERIFQDTEITNSEDISESDQVVTEQRFEFYDFSAKFLWDPGDKDQIRVNYLTIDNDLDFDQTLVTTENTITSKLEEKSTLGGISWRRRWSDRLTSLAQVSASFYQRDALNIILSTSQEQFQETEVLDTGIKTQINWLINSRFSLEAGYHFGELGISNTRDINLPRFRDFRKDVMISHVGFGQLTYRSPNSLTTATAGIRANYFEKFNEFIPEPRLHVYQGLGSGLAVEVSGEFKSQSATQRIDLQNDFLGVERRRWILTDNENILIKTSQQVSVGLLFQKNNWFINLEGYLKEVDDISSASQGFENQFQFIRTIGSYSVKGLEFTLNKKIKSISAWISYNYKTNDFNFPELNPPDFPNNLDIRHSLTASAAYTRQDLKVALGFNWRTGAPFTQPVFEDSVDQTTETPGINYDLPNSSRLPDYMRLDLSAEYNWEISSRANLQFNLALINLLDKQNTLNIRYDLNDNDGDGEFNVDRIEELSLGFTPNLGILFRWN